MMNAVLDGLYAYNLVKDFIAVLGVVCRRSSGPFPGGPWRRSTEMRSPYQTAVYVKLLDSSLIHILQHKHS